MSAQNKRLDPHKGEGHEHAKKESLRKLKNWRIDERFGEADTLAIDTLSLNYQDNYPIYNYSLASAWNGNLGSPVQSRLYFDRVTTGIDFYSAAYAPYLLTPSKVRLYNTHVPFSEIAYRTTSARYQEEDYIRALFTINMTAHWNVGMKINKIYARGQYKQQASDMLSGAFWATYYGRNYSMNSIFTINRYRNYLNGGIVSRDYILHPDKVDATDIDTENIPINLENTKAKYQNYSYFVNQKLNIGYWKKVLVAPDSTEIAPILMGDSTDVAAIRLESDSINLKNNSINNVAKTVEKVEGTEKSAAVKAEANAVESEEEYEEEYVKLASIIHTIDLEDTKRTFQEKSPLPTAFYKNTYYGDHRTLDLNRKWQLRNVLALELNQAVNPLGFAAGVFAEHEYVHYSAATDTLRLNSHNSNNLRVGGVLKRRSKGWLQYDALVQTDISGEKAGDYLLKGTLASDFKLGNEPIHLEADACIYQDTYLNYYSEFNTNHFKWTHKMDPKQAQQFGARLSLPNRDISFGVRAENVNNLMYFGLDSLPSQSNDLIQVLAADVKVGLHFGVYNWENQVVYQQSSDKKALPLPELTLYSNMYYKAKWFKVLDAQIGVSCRYNTAYYGNLFVPSTGAFVHQNKQLIGNYPLCNIYANFKVRTVRFFVQYNHANQSLLDMRDYFEMTASPLNPSTIQFGFSWSFYD
ncbi:putative porin [Gammaproteobacteria bacterium]|nr:putative porin [Gammaproteobacteria bacterium]